MEFFFAYPDAFKLDETLQKCPICKKGFSRYKDITVFVTCNPVFKTDLIFFSLAHFNCVKKEIK